MVYVCALCVHWAAVVVTIHRVWHLCKADVYKQECNPSFAPIYLLLCPGESAVHFSANVAKINRQNKIQERIMLITGK